MRPAGESYTFGVGFSPELERADPTIMDFTTTGNVSVRCVSLIGHKRFYTVLIEFPRIGPTNLGLLQTAQAATVALDASNFDGIDLDVELLNTSYGGKEKGQNLVIENKPSSVSRGSCETFFISVRPPLPGYIPPQCALQIDGGRLAQDLEDASDPLGTGKRFKFVVNVNNTASKLVITADPDYWSNIDVRQLELLDIMLVD